MLMVPLTGITVTGGASISGGTKHICSNYNYNIILPTSILCYLYNP